MFFEQCINSVAYEVFQYDNNQTCKTASHISARHTVCDVHHSICPESTASFPAQFSPSSAGRARE